MWSNNFKKKFSGRIWSKQSFATSGIDRRQWLDICKAPLTQPLSAYSEARYNSYLKIAWFLETSCVAAQGIVIFEDW